MTDPTVFPETNRAAELLRQFYNMSGKGRRLVSPAVQSYFDKDVLTIMEFLAPLGEMLVKPVPPGTIGDFLTAAIRKQPMKDGQMRTIYEFLTGIK